MPAASHLTVEECAQRYRTSPRAIHGQTRLGTIPHIKRCGFRRILFDVTELDLWDRGAELELVTLADGTRIVRTMHTKTAA